MNGEWDVGMGNVGNGERGTGVLMLRGVELCRVQVFFERGPAGVIAVAAAVAAAPAPAPPCSSRSSSKLASRLCSVAAAAAFEDAAERGGAYAGAREP